MQCTEIQEHLSDIISKKERLYDSSEHGAVAKESIHQRTTIINDDLDKSDIEKISCCTQTTATWKSNEQLMEKNRILESERETTNDEIQRVMDEKTKQRNDILHLKQKIVTTENHAKTLRKSIKTKESVMDSMKNEMDIMKSEILKLREEENKSILAGGRSNSKEFLMDSNGEYGKQNKDTDDQTRIEKILEKHLRKIDIQDQLNEFSHDILAKVSQLVEEKLSVVENKIQTLASIPEEMNKNYKTFSETLQTNVPP